MYTWNVPQVCPFSYLNTLVCGVSGAAQVSWLVCKMCDLEFRTDQLVRKHSRTSVMIHQQQRPTTATLPAIGYKSTISHQPASSSTSTAASTAVSTATSTAMQGSATASSGNVDNVNVDDVNVVSSGDVVSQPGGRGQVSAVAQQAVAVSSGASDVSVGGQSEVSSGTGEMVVYDETGRRKHQCDVCNKLFNAPNALIIHKRTHTGEKPYKCTDCGMMFSVHGNLTTHRRTHSGEKPYSCDECGQTFSQSNSLNTHKRLHSGEKPYTCDDCGMTFNTSSTLVSHRRIHTGEKPYTCTDCGRAFSQSKSLNTHKRLHTGEKPYTCDDCGRAFSHSHSLLRHRRSVHWLTWLTHCHYSLILISSMLSSLFSSIVHYWHTIDIVMSLHLSSAPICTSSISVCPGQVLRHCAQIRPAVFL